MRVQVREQWKVAVCVAARKEGEKEGEGGRRREKEGELQQQTETETGGSAAGLSRQKRALGPHGNFPHSDCRAAGGEAVSIECLGGEKKGKWRIEVPDMKMEKLSAPVNSFCVSRDSLSSSVAARPEARRSPNSCWAQIYR